MTQLKRSTELDREFSKDETQMAEKHIKVANIVSYQESDFEILFYPSHNSQDQ